MDTELFAIRYDAENGVWSVVSYGILSHPTPRHRTDGRQWNGMDKADESDSEMNMTEELVGFDCDGRLQRHLIRVDRIDFLCHYYWDRKNSLSRKEKHPHPTGP